MFYFLKEILICPECHESLIWKISDGNASHIIEAEIKCSNCSKIYAVKNGMGCFVEYKETSGDDWQEGENRLMKLIAENPEIKEKIMITDIKEMNAADIMVRSMLCQMDGNTSEAERLFEIWSKKAYKEETLKASRAQIEYIVNYLKHKKDFVLDVASGSGTLVKELLEKTDALIISSDISFNIMEKAKKAADKNGYGDKVSYIVFDINKSPFLNKSIKTITTFVGFQNIPNPANIFREMRRICNDKVYSACIFCCEDSLVNLKSLEEAGLSQTWVKNKYIDAFNEADFSSVIENSIVVLNEPTPVGEIVRGIEIDGFPVEAGHFEYATVISG